MKIVTTKRDVIWNYIGTFISLGSSFLLLPFLVKGLSGADLGIWYVFTALGSFVMLFEFGFNPTFARNIAYCWSGAQKLKSEGITVEEHVHEEINVKLFAQLISVSKMVYARVTLIVALILIIPGTWYIWHVSGGQLDNHLFIAWALYVAATLVNMFYLYYAAMLRGIRCIAEDNKNKIFARLAQLVISAVLLLCGFGLVGATLGYCVYAIFYRIYGYVLFWCNPNVRKMNIQSIRVSKQERKEIFGTISHNAYKDGVVMLSNYGATQAGTLLCSWFLSLEQTGTYSIGLQLANAIGTVALAYFTSCRPAIQSAYQRNDYASIQRMAGKGIDAYIAIFVVATIGVLAVVYPLLHVINPTESYDPMIFLGLAVYMFIFNWIALFSSMIANFNSIPYMTAYVITSVAGILLSALLLGPLHAGPWGLVWGMALPQTCYNLWKWPNDASVRIKMNTLNLSKLGWVEWRKELTRHHDL